MSWKALAVVNLNDYGDRFRALFKNREPTDEEIGALMAELLTDAVQAMGKTIGRSMAAAMSGTLADLCPCPECRAGRRPS